mmetsp:Transcript_19263/g.62706  ORF Transcript_19263/g.62706 Transcript_19263/m.62706 type:complete len:298 (+) Transcript_19263:96-989(+)
MNQNQGATQAENEMGGVCGCVRGCAGSDADVERGGHERSPEEGALAELPVVVALASLREELLDAHRRHNPARPAQHELQPRVGEDGFDEEEGKEGADGLAEAGGGGHPERVGAAPRGGVHGGGDDDALGDVVHRHSSRHHQPHVREGAQRHRKTLREVVQRHRYRHQNPQTHKRCPRCVSLPLRTMLSRSARHPLILILCRFPRRAWSLLVRQERFQQHVDHTSNRKRHRCPNKAVFDAVPNVQFSDAERGHHSDGGPEQEREERLVGLSQHGNHATDGRGHPSQEAEEQGSALGHR